jgi:hypothetical protein
VFVLRERVVGTHLAKEPRNEVSKDNGFVGLGITGRRRDASSGPQVALPLIEPSVARAGIEEEYTGRAVNQPASVECLDTAILHRLDGGYQSRVLGFYGLHLDGGLASWSVLERQWLVAVLTDALFQGPMSVYEAPYSAVVTCALDLRTE